MPVVMQTSEQTASEQLPANVVELHVTGKLHKQDYRELGPKLEQLLAVHGKLRMLVTLIDFHGWDLGAMWEDLKMDLRHYAEFERIAVVGQTGMQHAMTDLFMPITGAKVKYFDVDHLDEAHRWISEQR